jgi:Heavy metal associated domain 2
MSKIKTKMNLQIAHQVPGRVRMKIPAGKNNPELLKQIGEVFGAIPGIEEIEVNPTTGSVVLRYDTDRHDEFHGTFNQHYAAHGAGNNGAPNGAATGTQNGAMHGADTDLDKLTGSIEAEAEFLASHSHSARVIVDFVKTLDREIKVATGNSVDLKILFAIGMIGFTVLEIGATAATPVWVTLAIFSVNHFIELHERQLKQEVAEIETPKLAPIRVAG